MKDKTFHAYKKCILLIAKEKYKNIRNRKFCLDYYLEQRRFYTFLHFKRRFYKIYSLPYGNLK